MMFYLQLLICNIHYNNVTSARFIARIIVFGDKDEKSRRKLLALSLFLVIFAVRNQEKVNNN